MAETVLGNVIEFFKTLGVYDVLLPFILVFSIMFAILERTKVFGTEGEGTKKNLNAMVSFVIAFLVVASSKLVAVITKVSSELIVLLLLVVFYMVLIGTFHTKADFEKGELLDKWWKLGFMVFIAISMVFIFLDALTTNSGETWLEVFWGWLSGFYNDTASAAIVLIMAVIIVVVVVTRQPKDK